MSEDLFREHIQGEMAERHAAREKEEAERRASREKEEAAAKVAFSAIQKASSPLGFRAIRSRVGYERALWARALGYEMSKGALYVSDFEGGRRTITPHIARLALMFESYGVPPSFLVNAKDEVEPSLAEARALIAASEASIVGGFDLEAWQGLREARTALGLSLEKIATRCSYRTCAEFPSGQRVSAATISDMERGLRPISLRVKETVIELLQQECRSPSLAFVRMFMFSKEPYVEGVSSQAAAISSCDLLTPSAFRAARATLGLNQREFAAALGYEHCNAQQYVSNMERGKTKPPAAVARLADMVSRYGVPAGWIHPA